MSHKGIHGQMLADQVTRKTNAMQPEKTSRRLRRVKVTPFVITKILAR